MVESDITAALSPLVDGRVFADVAPKGAALPRITFQQVGGKPLNYVSGVPAKRNGRFQINVWGADRAQVSAIVRQAEDILRLDSRLLATTLSGAVSSHEAATQLYGARQDFSIWFSQ